MYRRVISLRSGFGAQEAYDAFGAASSSVGDLQDGPHLKRRFSMRHYQTKMFFVEKLGPVMTHTTQQPNTNLSKLS